MVLHPLDRVSPIQRLQMTTIDADNVRNLAVRGDFDDCQRLVKGLLADECLRERRRFSSVNSINWARLAGQIPYYVSAVAQLAAQGETPRATYRGADRQFRRRLRRLAARNGWACRSPASSRPPTATTPWSARSTTASMRARPPRPPASAWTSRPRPTSNGWCSRPRAATPTLTRGLFEDFARHGRVPIPDDLLASHPRARCRRSPSTRPRRAEEIARTHREPGRVVCPHTAVALTAARAPEPPIDGPMVALSTAHPAKFPEAVRSAIGIEPERPQQLRGLEGHPERFETVYADLASVRAAIA